MKKLTQKQIIENITEIELLNLADRYRSATEILQKEFCISYKYASILNKKMIEYNIKFLNPNKGLIKSMILYKICPTCAKEFTTTKNSKEKTTCSRSCANSYFRSGKNHPNYLGQNYRIKAIEEYGHSCVICDEKNIIEIHHLDENHQNNDINNLIPLCPTHHRYMHSKFKYLILPLIKIWNSSRDGLALD